MRRTSVRDERALPTLSRPGGRTERNRLAVATAVLELIGTGNLDFELQEVAALSGVHRTTLSRRWPDRSALIGEAMREHVSKVNLVLTGDWRVDLRSVAFSMREFFNSPLELAMNRILAGFGRRPHTNRLESYYQPILSLYAMPIEKAQAEGIIAPEIDAPTIVLMVISPILAMTLFAEQPISDDSLEILIDHVIRACER